MPIDRKLVNKSQDYEINHFLDKKGYRQTKANRDLIISKIPNNSTWKELDEMPAEFFKGLEKKA
ncbi:hypothetical protein RCS94_05180 [Orbaceae bacterium ac157xtp]